MRPRFACADFTFPLLSHDQSLDLIKLLGFKAVDIGLFENRSHLWPSREYKKVGASARKLARKLARRGLKPADIYIQPAIDFLGQAPNHPDARHRRRMRKIFMQTLEYSAECGCSHVSALPGLYFKEESRAASFGRCVEELTWRCEQARELGITFSVEPHIGSIVPKPEDALKLVEQVEGLTLTLDYTHFTKMGIPDARVEPLIQHSSHFHARGARKGSIQSTVSNNTIDFARIVKVMQDVCYRGYVEIEYVWTEFENCNKVDNLSETILLRDVILKAYKELSRSKRR